MDYETSKSLFGESKYIVTYFKICDNQIKYRSGVGDHKHHFIPKYLKKEYASFKTNPWNCIVVSPRVHYILHVLLYKHHASLGEYTSAISNLRGMKNFSNNSRKYERFRMSHSKIMQKYWSSGKKELNVVRKKISSGVKRYYENNPQQVEKLKEWRTEWWKSLSNEQYEEFGMLISNTTREAMKNVDMKSTLASWRENNPNEYASYIANMKNTLNSDEYKNRKFKTCEHCHSLMSPSNYKQYHGDNCAKNPTVTVTKTLCKCCGLSFQRFNSHLSRSEVCKQFYEHV